MGEASELHSRFSAKALTELAAADKMVAGSEVARSGGDPLARVMLVKGVAGAADLEAGKAIAGPDYDAAVKALAALGFEVESVFTTVSRPSGARGEDALGRLALQIEAVDPSMLVALDAIAADDLAAVAKLPVLPFGEPQSWAGRALVAVDGLEESLTDEVRKRRVWEQFRSLAR